MGNIFCVTYFYQVIQNELVPVQTLEGAMLRAVGGDEVQRYVGCTTNVLVRKTTSGALVASTHHTLAEKISSSNHKHQQDDGNDWADGVGAGVGNATGGRRHVFYTCTKKKKKSCRRWKMFVKYTWLITDTVCVCVCLPQESSSDPSGQSE